jgi:vitamin-K-epoxide reductase (warfarin-sensitive)
MMILTFILAILGLLISLYIYHIERNLKKNPAYKPACNLSDKISCTKPIESKYGSFLSISNALWGIMFYSLVALLALFSAKILVLIMTLGSVAVSVFLAYTLYAKLRVVCLMCTALYIVNGLLLYASIKAVWH